MIVRNLYAGPDFCAVEENGKLVEYLEKENASYSGIILGGKVERLMPGIGCAFVDIGRKTSGFLPLKENSLSFGGSTLRSGMLLPVQIKKEETGEKGAFLTRDLAIPGGTLLLMPMNRYIGVSNRITDVNQRAKLRALGKSLAGDSFGLVLREAALGAGRTQLEQEFIELKELWEQIARRIREGFSPGQVLYQPDPLDQMKKDYELRGISGISETQELPAGLMRQLAEAKERKIRLPGGGNIIIDKCEAMTVIDVNSGSAHSSSAGAGILFETNLDACETIGRQIRLRDLGGMILIDFIDMDSDEERAQVEEKLRTVLRCDRRKTVIHGWTRLGILELTRKRTGRS